MSILAASFGDVHPDPKDHFEFACLAVLFVIGIAIWGAIMVILSAYVTDVFVEKCKQILRINHRFWIKDMNKKSILEDPFSRKVTVCEEKNEKV